MVGVICPPDWNKFRLPAKLQAGTLNRIHDCKTVQVQMQAPSAVMLTKALLKW